MSVQPAKAFGIYGRKGDIKPGFDADLLIVDPEKEWEITSDSLLYVNKISAFVWNERKRTSNNDNDSWKCCCRRRKDCCRKKVLEHLLRKLNNIEIR